MSNIQRESLLRTSYAWRTSVILTAIIASLAAGASLLAYPSIYSPLAVIVPVAVVGIAIFWLHKPVWALYAAVFVVLLPIGLIPSNIHSILNRSMAVAALAIWLFDVLTQHRRVQWTSTATFMVGFLVWGTVTLIWAEDLSRGVTLLQTYALRLILFLFLIPNAIKTRHDLNGLMNTLALAGWVLVLVSMGTILKEGYIAGTRLSVLGVNENSLGILAMLTMLGVLWQAIQSSKQHRVSQHLAASAFLLLAIGLVAISGSRGSAISLVITLLLFLLWRPTRPWGALGVLILALGAAVAPFIFSTTLERLAIVRGDTLLGGREALWQAASKLILDHPWNGVGIGNAPYAVLPYLRPLRSILSLDWASLHNPLLTIWAETGFMGLLLYLAVLGSAVWSFLRQYLHSRRLGEYFLTPYFALVCSAFVGYMFSWIKGGGMESDFSYFLMLALLTIPSHLNIDANVVKDNPER